MKPFPEARILEVDLTAGAIATTVLPSEVYRLYPGGSALATYLIARRMKPRADALGPDNLLVFAVSPLTGLAAPGLSRLVVTAKSPLTGTIGDSQGGGFFPAYLRANGWDAVVFRGRAERPVYLFIDGDKAELRPAGHLWGKVTGEVDDLVREEIGHPVVVAQIGPAGERLVRFACVLSHSTRANGRNGMGAVMGSKNLKAVVVRKVTAREAADPERLKGLTANVRRRLADNAGMEALGRDGTDGELVGHHQAGFLPTRNFSSGWFPEGAERITGAAMTATILKGRETCFGCPIRCKRVVEVPGLVDPRYGGPEYETAASFGSYCGVADLATIARANQLCNMYGLDTISCGGTVAFAMEAYEKGILTRRDTGGLELRFGDGEAVLKLIEMIARREGLGDLLAEGSLRAGKKLGRGAEEGSVTVKGQELPAHMPQYKPSVGLIYAVNPFGADHQSSEHDPVLTMPPDSRERVRLSRIGSWRGYADSFALDEEKVRFAHDTQCFYSMLDTLCLCQFVWGPAWQLYGPDDVVELCQAGLGWETSLVELMRAGERRINLMRAFNAREGFTREDDKLPARIFAGLPEGPAKGARIDREQFDHALDLYYGIAGWDRKTGNPTPEKLKALSLGWMSDGRDATGG
ncbi:MAG: aldehyde ferredoxin oxidoreductase family protein [Bacillota bacterium]